MRIRNEYMQVEIAAAGAELTSVYDLKRDQELLWNGDPAYWKRRSPILFPNVGKTYANVMRIGGKTYPTSQHGFARDMDFTLESSDETSACFLLTSNADTLARYPYPFELRIRYELQDDSLIVSWLVTNPGKEEMAFTIGGHPAFCFDPGEGKTDYCLRFPGLEQLEYLLLDPASGTAQPDAKEILPLKNGILPLTDELFANDALILDDGQVEEVWLCRRDGTPRVGMKCPGFPNYGVWSVQGAGFVCLEPWAGRCDNCGFEDELSAKPNVNLLAPGKTFEKSYSILLPNA
ncbi:MAG: aldose 1-epimerase family protein [Clostridia bacterium]|nr:aldose 1-epimerase family protein [Clostridia bacterium]